MGRTQKGRVADLSKALLRGTASLRDSLWGGSGRGCEGRLGRGEEGGRQGGEGGDHDRNAVDARAKGRRGKPGIEDVFWGFANVAVALPCLYCRCRSHADCHDPQCRTSSGECKPHSSHSRCLFLHPRSGEARARGNFTCTCWICVGSLQHAENDALHKPSRRRSEHYSSGHFCQECLAKDQAD